MIGNGLGRCGGAGNGEFQGPPPGQAAGAVEYGELPGVGTPFTADFDKDLDVDGDDFLIWQSNFGLVDRTPNQGDADGDGDGDADGDDFLAWQAQFGSLVATPSVSAVPEPATVTTAILLLTCLVFHRWPVRPI